MAVSFAAALTAISAVVGITTQVTDVVLKYDEKTYRTQIGEVEAYNPKFTDHLTKLDGLKSRLQSAWDDDNTKEYIKSIDKERAAVNNAMEQADKTVKMLKSVLENISTGLVVSDEVGQIQSILNKLEIKD